jgi:hypothetical protein
MARRAALKVDREHVVLLAHDEPGGFVAPRRIGDDLVVRRGGERSLRAVQKLGFVGPQVLRKIATKSLEGQHEAIFAVRLDFGSAGRCGIAFPPIIE